MGGTDLHDLNEAKRTAVIELHIDMCFACVSVSCGPFETKLGANASYKSPATVFTTP